ESRIEELSDELKRLTHEFNLLKDFVVNLAERYGMPRPGWLVGQSCDSFDEDTRNKLYTRERYQQNLEWAEIWDRQGTFSEDVIAPCLGSLLGRMLGAASREVCLVQTRQVRRHPLDGHKVACFDCIAEFGEFVITVRTTRVISYDDVDNVLQTMREVWEFFPEYRGRKIIGCAGGLHVLPEVVRYASEKGIIVLAVGSGRECVEVKNELGFRPGVFQFECIADSHAMIDGLEK
ncbi:MAG: hypothetical protein ACPL7J_12090, partial [Desulfomonilaceae bacterium]